MSRAEQYRRGKEYLTDIKAQSGCVICGESELAVLDFHHRNETEKSFNLSGAASAKSLERLRAEVEKTIVVCSSCHRRIHAGLIELDEEGYPIGQQERKTTSSGDDVGRVSRQVLPDGR